MQNDDKKINELLSHYTIDSCDDNLQSKIMQRITDKQVKHFIPFFSLKPLMAFLSVIVCGVLLISLLPNTQPPVMDAETFLHTTFDPQIEEIEMAMVIYDDEEIDVFLDDVFQE